MLNERGPTSRSETFYGRCTNQYKEGADRRSASFFVEVNAFLFSALLIAFFEHLLGLDLLAFCANKFCRQFVLFFDLKNHPISINSLYADS